MLYLRPGTREHFLEKLAGVWPELLSAYEQIYAGRSYLTDKETRPRRATVQQLAREFEIADRRRVRLAAPSPAEKLQLALSDDVRALAA